VAMKWLVATTLVASTAVVPMTVDGPIRVSSETKTENVNYVIMPSTFQSKPVSPLLTFYRESSGVKISGEVQTLLGPSLRQLYVGMILAAENRVEWAQSLQDYIGVPYVYSGSSPRGWDCSGFTMWAYQQLGIELPHSASAQARLGTEVSEPAIGDLVAFFYNGSSSARHVAIYIGNGKLIHAGFKPGARTEILPIDSPYVTEVEIKFFRVV